MGLTYAEIELISTEDLSLHYRGYLKDEEVRRAKVNMLADCGSYMLAVNEHLKAQLGLRVLDQQEAELADGSHVMLDIVGPVDVRFANRATTVRAMVLPGDAEMLLGCIPMEDMDVLIDPKSQQLIVNPANPYVAKKHLK